MITMTAIAKRKLVDLIEDIMGSRFDFNNEKIESKCGCGTSFSMKDT